MNIYADHAATTAMSEAAIEAMTRCMREEYGNPSSLYRLGQHAKEVLEQARENIAAVINADPREIYFTSGGSEADNQAIRSAALSGKRKGKTHIISTAFEHHAVLHTLAQLKTEGFEVTLLDVHENGVILPEEVEAAIRPETCLVTVMYANNEIGTIQPVREIGAICRGQLTSRRRISIIFPPRRINSTDPRGSVSSMPARGLRSRRSSTAGHRNGTGAPERKTCPA